MRCITITDVMLGRVTLFLAVSLLAPKSSY
jgi:hypothetical protein